MLLTSFQSQFGFKNTTSFDQSHAFKTLNLIESSLFVGNNDERAFSLVDF